MKLFNTAQRPVLTGRTIWVHMLGQAVDLPSYRPLRLSRFVYGTRFEVFISSVIVLNAFALASITFPSLSFGSSVAAIFVMVAAGAIYLIELTLRIFSYGKKPWMFFTSGWNVFDFLVILGVPVLLLISTDEPSVALLNLLMLLRLVRIFRFLPEFRILVSSLIKSLPPLGSMTVLISMMMFLYGMLGTYMFGKDLPNEWGNIAKSLRSLFVLLTTENFPAYLDNGYTVTSWAGPFFISYVLILVFIVLNVFIGIVLHAMDQAREADALKKAELAGVHQVATEVDSLLLEGKISVSELASLEAELRRIRGASF